MKAYAADALRNVALLGHGGSGKTSLAERLLFETGATKRVGRVEDGTSTSDWDEEEVKRQISIQTSVIPLEWRGTKINVLDTPGYFDFAGEVRAALRVVEGAIWVVCAASGVEVGTEQTWKYADDHRLARLIFVNKMDRENADFRRTLDELRSCFGPKIVPIHLPIGQEADFSGVVDLVQMRAYRSGAGEPEPVPPELEAEAKELRDALVEAVAATDDELTMKYLEEENLTSEEIGGALKQAVRRGELAPVLVGSATAGTGVRLLLEACCQLLPSPADVDPPRASDDAGEEVVLPVSSDGATAALVFKTTADPYVGRLTLFRVYSGTVSSDTVLRNVQKGADERIGQVFVMRGKEQIAVHGLGPGDIGAVAKLQRTTTSDTLCSPGKTIVLPGISFPRPSLRLAVHPRNKGDEEKISASLARLAEDDPTLQLEKDAETGEFLAAGTGETHLEVMVSRLQRKFGVEVDLKPPKIPYRETIRSQAKAEGKHKKQTGGRGQYGHVFLELEPLPPGGGFEFVDKIFGGAVPRQYIPAVEKGVRETMAEGVLAGYPVVDVRVTLYDGSYHSVDSSEMAFKIAASMAFKKGFLEANPVLLEPILNVDVLVPEAFMGDVMGDLNKKRGRIIGMEPENGLQRIRAHVPMAEMSRYAIELRSLTQGRGSFTASFSHYEEVPAQQAEAVIAANRKDQVS